MSPILDVIFRVVDEYDLTFQDIQRVRKANKHLYTTTKKIFEVMLGEVGKGRGVYGDASRVAGQALVNAVYCNAIHFIPLIVPHKPELWVRRQYIFLEVSTLPVFYALVDAGYNPLVVFDQTLRHYTTKGG
ncbi:hypothetical protein HDV00_007177 [Rhizophlyctis rosea]|nr:hypothetical protein HDV00_007177 [Rhizophlyctis rosea]